VQYVKQTLAGAYLDKLAGYTFQFKEPVRDFSHLSREPEGYTDNPIAAAGQDQEQRKFLSGAGKLMLGALGIGTGAGALRGLASFLGGHDVDTGPLDYSPASVPVEIPVAAPARKKRRLMDYLGIKTAGEDDTPGLVDRGIDAMRGLMFKSPTPGTSVAGKAVGDKSLGIWEAMNKYPWQSAAAGAGILGAGYGGYALTSWLAKRRRKREQEMSLEDASKAYEQAMLAQYTRPLRKQADDSSKPMDVLYEKWLEKRALFWGADPISLALLYALGTGSASAYYGWYKNRGERQKSLDAALRRRAGLRYQETPPEMFVQPVQRPVASYDPEEEDEGKQKRKVTL
jgi:hypothetical protein